MSQVPNLDNLFVRQLWSSLLLFLEDQKSLACSLNNVNRCFCFVNQVQYCLVWALNNKLLGFQSLFIRVLDLIAAVSLAFWVECQLLFYPARCQRHYLDGGALARCSSDFGIHLGHEECPCPPEHFCCSPTSTTIDVYLSHDTENLLFRSQQSWCCQSTKDIQS